LTGFEERKSILGHGAGDFQFLARLHRQYAIDSNSSVGKAPQRSGDPCHGGVAQSQGLSKTSQD
jgi:hypothetical protein